MMKVAMIALLAAPCALAFTVENLAGVWSCTVEHSTKYKTKQNSPAVTPAATAGLSTALSATPGIYTSVVDTSRVVVFDKVLTVGQTRKFTGRSYYDAKVSNVAKREEHNFHGFMKTATDGAFYLDENAWNNECNLWLTDSTGTFVRTTQGTLRTQPTGATAAVLADGKTKGTADSIADNLKYPPIAGGAYIYQGSCQTRPEGPWDFVMEDADHFTLTVDATDLQLDNYQASGSAINRVHSIEKCMRGLPLNSPICAELSRSKITSDTQKNDACQGTLICGASTSSSPGAQVPALVAGAAPLTGTCQKPPAPTQPQFPQYYYPQPQYYQQPFQQYQPYQQQNPFQFYGR